MRNMSLSLNVRNLCYLILKNSVNSVKSVKTPANRPNNLHHSFKVGAMALLRPEDFLGNIRIRPTTCTSQRKEESRFQGKKPAYEFSDYC